MIAIVIGSVSKAFLPCLSERLPIKGVTISVPKPVTYINFNLLSNITKKNSQGLASLLILMQSRK